MDEKFLNKLAENTKITMIERVPNAAQNRLITTLKKDKSQISQTNHEERI